MEPNVIVRGRQIDADLIRNVIPQAVEKYKELSGKDCNVHIDQEGFLPQNATGGVEVLAQTGRIKVLRVESLFFFVLFRFLFIPFFSSFLFRLLTLWNHVWSLFLSNLFQKFEFHCLEGMLIANLPIKQSFAI